MFYLVFLIKSALFDFARNKVRAFLTSLGILIGVASVVLLYSFISGFRLFIKSQFVSLGANLVAVVPGRFLSQGGGFRPGGGIFGGVRFDEKDLVTIKKIPEVEYAAPFFVKTVQVDVGQESKITDLRGTNEEAFIISHLEAEYGRILNKRDVEKRSKVAVLGASITDALFGNKESAIGRTIKIDNLGFNIVGVLKPVGEISHFFDSTVFLPYSTAFGFSQDKKFFEIHIQAEDQDVTSYVKSQIKQALLKRYKEDDFSVVDQTEILETLGIILNALGGLLLGISAVSLIVGGIGIMNIMYVSVTERIKEIGIRRAVGAKKSDILWQFLSEAIILSLIGGLLGLLLAFLITLVVQRFFPAFISWQSVILALGVSSIIGIVFGVFPAKKAADLPPIDAIRYE